MIFRSHYLVTICRFIVCREFDALVTDGLAIRWQCCRCLVLVSPAPHVQLRPRKNKYPGIRLDFQKRSYTCMYALIQFSPRTSNSHERFTTFNFNALLFRSLISLPLGYIRLPTTQRTCLPTLVSCSCQWPTQVPLDLAGPHPRTPPTPHERHLRNHPQAVIRGKEKRQDPLEPVAGYIEAEAGVVSVQTLPGPRRNRHILQMSAASSQPSARLRLPTVLQKTKMIRGRYV